MSPTQLKLVMDSIVWAFRHTERNIAETGLNLLLEMLTSFEKNDFVTQFHQTYWLQLVREIFAVMTGESSFPLSVRYSDLLRHSIGAHAHCYRWMLIVVTELLAYQH